MTRKHYKIIAEAIRNEINIVRVVDNLVIAFQNDNKNFDSDKFYEACGIKASDDDTRSNK